MTNACNIPPRICAVVLNYNGYEKALQCVDTLLAQDYPALDILVVDNHSPNESYSVLRERLRGKAVVISTSNNLGYAGGNNFGVRWRLQQGHVEYIAIINNDVLLPDPHTFTVLAAFAEATPDLAAISPKITLPSGWIQGPYEEPSIFLFAMQYLIPPLWYVLRNRRQRKAAAWTEPGPVFRTMGAFMLLKTQAFVRCGLFDEHTFIGADEDILAEKFAKQGLRFYHHPGTSVIHNHGYDSVAAFGKVGYFLKTQRSAAYYFRHYRGAHWMSLSLFNIASYVYAYCFLPLRSYLKV